MRRFETKKANLKIIRFDSIDQTNVRHTTTGNTHARTHGFAGSGGGDGNGLVQAHNLASETEEDPGFPFVAGRKRSTHLT